MLMVAADGLVYEYGRDDEDQTEDGSGEREAALDGVRAEIKKGEFIVVLGRNGSGKSTFAKLINALLIPTEGTIFVNGLDTRVPDNVWEIRKSAGMVFQNPDNQIIASVVEEDIAFGPENLGVPPKEIRERVDAALSAVGMSDYANHSPHFLSGGQKQRVAIAGALAMKPECIVFDEPTSMLDPIGRREVIETITRLNKNDGMTIILITHFMDEAVIADRVLVMDGGKIVMSGTPREVFSNVAELREIGLDVPQAAEIALKLRAKGYKILGDILTVSELADAVEEALRQ